MRTINDVILSRGKTSGFDYLRLVLALSVIAWHTIAVCYGRHVEYQYWTGPLRPVIIFVVPSFFALSGFLVAGSLERNTLPAYLSLRALRICPALAVEVVFSALIIGLAVTTYSLGDYLNHPTLRLYFLNIIGYFHRHLPGVFTHLPVAGEVNAQLWTISYELKCYVALAFICLVGLLRRPRILFALCCLAVVADFIKHYELVGWPGRGAYSPPRMLVESFFFGVCIFLLRRNVPFSATIFFLSLPTTWLLLEGTHTFELATLPLAYVTIFFGLQNPRKSFFIRGVDYSYGIYLYGFIIQQLVVFLFPFARFPAANFLISTILVWLCAWASWNFIESKVLRKKREVVNAVNSITEKLRAIVFVATRLGK